MLPKAGRNFRKVGIAKKIRGMGREVAVGETLEPEDVAGGEAEEACPGGFEEVSPRAGAAWEQRK